MLGMCSTTLLLSFCALQSLARGSTATLIGESHKGHSRVIPAGQCEGVGMFRSAGEKGTIEISSLNGEIQSISVVAGKGSHDEVTVDFPSPSWSKAAQHK